MLARFGLLGPVGFVMVKLPETRTEGTGLDEACLTDHHGLVTRGWLAVHHADGRSETLAAGDASYVPEGPPTHTFSGSPRCHVQGSAVVPADTDTSTEALRALVDPGYRRSRNPTDARMATVVGGGPSEVARPVSGATATVARRPRLLLKTASAWN